MSRRIFQFWHDAQSIPDVIRDNFLHNKRLHSDYTFVTADDRFMHRFLSDQQQIKLLKLYKENRIPASRCDIARVVLLLKFGGIYLDASIRCLTRIDTYFANRLPESHLILAKRHSVRDNKIANAVIVARRPNNWILREILNQMVSNLERRVFNYKVFQATGPGLYRKIIGSHPNDKTIGYVSFDNDLLSSIIELMPAEGFKNAWVEQQKYGIYLD